MTETLFAYGGLFVWSFLAATLLPIGSELALIALVRTEGQTLAPVFVATAGNYLGACTTYWIGRRAAQVLAEKRRRTQQESRNDIKRNDVKQNDTKRDETKRESQAAHLLRRYGQPALLLSWIPFIGDAIVALAGAARMPFVPFTFWVVAGKAARYAAIAWAAKAI